ncbi:hypothetical protein FQA39_LY16758 [Lamprigera yunnana]|nr:hypothetical protein FQA39_LY16758 [Lamprigera yunnana]
MTIQSPLDKLAVENFREYLRIPSVQPDVNYDASVAFLQKLAKDIGLQCVVHEQFPKKPFVVISCIGEDPSLQSILLNNHMDVVPAFEAQWTHKPFAADIDENGNIYARGAQDMKCLSIEYLEAIRRLKLSEVKLRRTIHVSFAPDEEIGGAKGMMKFAKSKEFASLNVGFAIDECFPNEGDLFAVATGEKAQWHFRIHVPGSTGHSSQMFENTAPEKLYVILDRFYSYRRKEMHRLKKGNVKISDVVSINVTQIEGGVPSSVLPSKIIVCFDCRFPLHQNMDEWEKTMNSWCKEAGDDVWIEYLQKNPLVPATKLDASNKYWNEFQKAANKLNLKLQVQTLEGGTDIRHVRALGIPAIGFSAVFNTPNREHKDDEYLNVDVFLKGIAIYCGLIEAVANA